MKVAICQYDMQWESAASNLPVVEELIAKADADLVLTMGGGNVYKCAQQVLRALQEQE